MGTLSGEATLISIFASHLIRGQLLKKKICSIKSKFFTLRVDLILKGLHCVKKSKQEVTKVVSLCKNDKNPIGVLKHLKDSCNPIGVLKHLKDSCSNCSRCPNFRIFMTVRLGSELFVLVRRSQYSV